MKFNLLKTRLTKLILLNLLLTNMAVAQDLIPFLQTFDDDSFLYTGVFNLVVSSREHPEGTKVVGPILEEARDYSWAINPKYSNFGNSLKLTVHPEDIVSTAPPKSRSELRINIQNENKKTYYYSWKLFIPTDSEFIEDGGNTTKMHIINQIINSTNDNDGNKLDVVDRKLLGMSYHHSNEPDSLPRKLSLRLYENSGGDSTRNKLHARINIPDAILKGQWNEFIFKIHWSENDITSSPNDYGSLEIFINRKQVVVDETINGSSITYNCHLGTSKFAQNSTFSFPNTVLTNDTGMPVQNFMKLGHYREYQEVETQSFYIDDYRITTEFPMEYNRTKLIPKYCNQEVEIDEMIVDAYQVSDANNYVFKFEKDGVIEFVGNGPSTALDLTNLSFLEANATYNVSVRARRVIGGVEEFGYGYGESCAITIPSYTRLKDEFINKTLYPGNLVVEYYPVPDAREYKIRLRNEETGEIKVDGQTLGSSTSKDLALYASYIKPGTYWVRMSVNLNTDPIDDFRAYGDSVKIVVSSSTRLKDDYINKTLYANNLFVEFYPVPDAYKYKIRVEEVNNINNYRVDGNIYAPTVNKDLSLFSSFISSTSYNIKVAVQLNGDSDFRSYGEVTQVHVNLNSSPPVAPNSNIELEISNNELNDKDIAVFPNPTAQYLNIKTLSEGKSLILIYDTKGTIVHEETQLGSLLSIDVLKLKAGLYLLNVVNEDHTVFKTKIQKL